MSDQLFRIGWREWVALPELGVQRIKAKIDTGARTSALHVTNQEVFQQDGVTWLRFAVHPNQRSNKNESIAVAQIRDWRSVKSSNGKKETRPVILTKLHLAGHVYPIELTLTRRDEMGFRLLLGRQALRKRFIVDVGHSYLSSVQGEQL